MSYNIERQEIIVYKLRNKDTSIGWADISLDGNGSRCRVSVASDYGNWSYYWGACGTDYKKFLISLGMDYVASKTGNSQFFDLESTINLNKREIIDARKNRNITAKVSKILFM